MKKWTGSAAICVNEEKKVLMVLQGQPHEEKVWSVPSGGIEKSEDPQTCCIREILEETGYEAKILEKLFEKKGRDGDYETLVHYYKVKITGGKPKIQDPDQLIYDIAWKSHNELQTLELSFPEDRELLLKITR